MVAIDRLIEPIRQFTLAGQSAMPFTLVIGESSDSPLRQFQIDQCQRGVGPGTYADQLLDPLGLAGMSL